MGDMGLAGVCGISCFAGADLDKLGPGRNFRLYARCGREEKKPPAEK
jgi:hypothetical protein